MMRTTPRTNRAVAWLLLAIAAWCCGASAEGVDLEQRLAACSACHGKLGEGVRGAEYVPHLAGKPAGYLFAQMQSFRDGRRVNAQMTWLLQFADDAWLRTIADHYAAAAPRTRAADTGADQLTPERRAVAVALATRGDAGRDVPACSQCHGQALAGLEPGIPALVGLPAEYIIAQLGNWRSGSRRAVAPDCMKDVADAIAPEDIRAVATWLSQQSHADGQRPARAGSWTPPRPCGALPHADATR